jgi:hypothetical protein
MGSVKRIWAPLLLLLPQAYGEALPAAVVHQPYHHQLVSPGSTGCTGYQPVFQLTGGSLPGGLKLHADGRIGGEPLRVEAGSMTVRISTPCSDRAEEWEWSIQGAPMVFVEPGELTLDSRTTATTALVSASWPGLRYSVSMADGTPIPPWLRVRARKGRTPPQGSSLTADQLAISIEPSRAPPGAKADLLVHTWRGSEPAMLTVRFGPNPARND